MNFAYGVQRKSDEEHLKSNKFSGFSTQKILFPLRCEIFSGTFRQRNNWVWLQNKNFCVTNTDLHLVVKCFQFSPPIITKGFNQMKKKISELVWLPILVTELSGKWCLYFIITFTKQSEIVQQETERSMSLKENIHLSQELFVLKKMICSIVGFFHTL